MVFPTDKLYGKFASFKEKFPLSLVLVTDISLVLTFKLGKESELVNNMSINFINLAIGSSIQPATKIKKRGKYLQAFIFS
jgi:hypothetical protein